MIDIIVAVVLLLIIGGALIYIRKQKEKGVKCIGCPDSGSCGGHCSGGCSGAGECKSNGKLSK
ncbi:MAG: FeoB-associated Cys-rich membrane protein [Lachnospiraceae bacterium]|nr:FeoB-associated Cys-rich membrane protein [Lachnospiraceae bacterium]